MYIPPPPLPPFHPPSVYEDDAQMPGDTPASGPATLPNTNFTLCSGNEHGPPQ
jgi:hypothetical protein